MKKIKFRKPLLVFFVAMAMLLAGWFFYLASGNSKCDYIFLNQALECSERPVISKAGYIQFKTKLSSEIANLKAEGKVDNVAVFFRDLENGPTFGINEKENFIPASLLKVPVMLTYFKLAEDDPALLQKELIYSSASKALENEQTIASEKILEINKPYAIDELIFRMAAYSDNRSYDLLSEYLKILSLDADLLSQTYTKLGMIDPGEDIALANLSVKTYASIFRLLFNASYLSNELSEKALKYLSYADYAGGLRGGVPKNIPIARKFGERWFSDGRKQLHDCGIIYFPGNPYLLCVMSRGKNFEDLSGVISQISQAVWEEIKSR
ncbi:MAG: serine hydrolase [bacterium]|nr:serine hydrolase [bacterium]